MNNAKRVDELRRAQNPLFNDKKLKLGTFGSNLNGGCAISTVDGTLKADWPSTLAVSRLADEMGFEALVPVGRWRGFGGKTNFNGPGFETYSWAAGIAALTENACVFSTSHVPTVHPIMAAKQATTIDHISGGRYALNIVTGWHKPEIDMFGAPLLDHDVRYDVAVEWLDIIKRLWTREEEFDFEGKYFKIQKGYLEPKPLQKPYPVVMNAGGSDRGRHYAAKYCDVAFVVLDTHEFDGAKARVDAYRDLARKEYGREIEVWSYSYVYQGRTEKEAKDYFELVTGTHGDIEAATNLVETMGINALTFPPGVLDQMKIHFMAGWGGYPLIGTPEQIVDGLATLSRMGLDGTLLSWPRYIDDMKWFKDNVMPLVNQSGLR